MGKGVSKTILIGNLGADPELRHTAAGTAVATVNLATSESWKGNDGQQHEETEWHRVVFWNRLAEIAGEYLKKGSKIYVLGRNKTRKWDDKDGITRYSTEVIANEMEMLDSRAGSSSSSGNSPPPQGQAQQGQSASPGQNQTQSQSQPAPTDQEQAHEYAMSGDGLDDNDIAF